MAEKMPEEQVEAMITALGVDGKTARAMRAANQVPEPEAPGKPARRKGIGAPAQDQTPLPRGI